MAQRAIAQAQQAVYSSVDDFADLYCRDDTAARKLVAAIRRYRQDHTIESDQLAFESHRTENERVAAGGKRRRRRGPGKVKAEEDDDEASTAPPHEDLDAVRSSEDDMRAPPSSAPPRARAPPSRDSIVRDVLEQILPMLMKQQQELIKPLLGSIVDEEAALKFGCRSCETLKRQLEEQKVSSSCTNCDDLRNQLQDAEEQRDRYFEDARVPCGGCSKLAHELAIGKEWPAIEERCERHVNTVYAFFGEPNVDDTPSDLFSVVYNVVRGSPGNWSDAAYFDAILGAINSVKEGARRGQLLSEYANVFGDRTTRPFLDSLIVHAYNLRYNNDIELQQLRDKIRRLQSEGGYDEYRSKMEKKMDGERERHKRAFDSAVKELVDLREENRMLLRGLREEQKSKEISSASAPASKKRRNQSPRRNELASLLSDY